MLSPPLYSTLKGNLSKFFPLNLRRRNTNSNEDRDPEGDHLDRSDQRQRSNSRHQILYGEVNGRDIKRISGEFVRIENLEKAVKSRSKAADEYPQGGNQSEKVFFIAMYAFRSRNID